MNRKLTHIPRADEEPEVDDLIYPYDELLVTVLTDRRFDNELIDNGGVISRTTEVMG